MTAGKAVIGVDYGTDSVRAVVVDACTGEQYGTAVHPYTRWARGDYCDAAKHQFRQHPLDYIEGLEKTVIGALAACPAGVDESVAGISIDTTGSTPVAVDREGTPLALKDEFAENPNAMFILWKDHTAVAEAEEVNTLAHSGKFPDFTKYSGGIYSAEWFWAKILHTLRVDEKVRAAAWSWVEHCDWLPALLTGDTDPLKIKRSRCAAGHKALWHESFEGLPSEEFLTALDPLLSGLRERLYRESFPSDVPAGRIAPAWAARLGVPLDTVIGVGAFDAHMGAVGAEIRPFTLTKVMGTSTCDMMVASHEAIGDRCVRGICGQVDGSIIPGLVGLEAGQSAFGDVYAWFKNLLLWPLEACGEVVSDATRTAVADAIIPALSEAAAKLPVDDHALTALDWFNGRRTPDADQTLTGAITGLRLGSNAPHVFKALVEATAFGSKKIIERFQDEGVRVDSIIALGGVARKSPYIMQTVADVLDMKIQVARADEACALGAAMFAATAAGVYETVEEAQAGMGAGIEHEYTPQPERAATYRKLYDKYSALAEFVEERKV